MIKVTELIDNGKLGLAIALNQEEYGKMDGFLESLNQKEGKAASDSFFNMIKANPTFERIDSNKERKNLNLDESQQIEAIASRINLIGKYRDSTFDINNDKDYKEKIKSSMKRNDENEKFEETFFGNQYR